MAVTSRTVWVAAAIASIIAAWGANSFFNQSTPPLFSPASVNGIQELAKVLSSNASVLLSGSDGYVVATDRWNRFRPPHFEVIVEVATEDDVSHTIRFANAHQRPFLAISGTHGAKIELGDLHRGVGISMRRMNDVSIADDGESAMVGGGILTKALIDTLWENGKMSTTGVCECTGVISPMLGGGHGWLQGQYGLMADNLLSARMVLGNGTAITVSPTRHADLFWAIRGAGHNFGIVTEVQYRIYDRTPQNEQWTVRTLIYTQDKLEPVFTAANEMMNLYSDDARLGHWLLAIRNPDLDLEPVIMMVFVFQNTSIPPIYTDPFAALSPVVDVTSNEDLRGIAKHFMTDLDGFGCHKGMKYLPYPAGVHRYDIVRVRKAYSILADLPLALKASWIAFEGYSSRGVRSVPADSTAFPDRHNDLLLSPFMIYAPDDYALDEKARFYGRQIQKAFYSGSAKPLNAYVNYAIGEESNEEIYGHEAWRLEKLRSIKALYDPEGRFNHYSPITAVGR